MTAITPASPTPRPTPRPSTDPSTGAAARALLRFAALVDTRDWDGLADQLSPGFTATFAVDGRAFDRDSFVAFQADYPGVWRFLVEDLVDGGDRAVIRSVVTDGAATFHVASFATVDTGGAIVRLTELWADGEGG